MLEVAFVRSPIAHGRIRGIAKPAGFESAVFTMQDLARMSGRFAIPVPFAACRALTACWWALHLPIFHFPSPLWFFIRYPWVVSPDRLIRELGFQFQHSSRDVIRFLLKDVGRLKA